MAAGFAAQTKNILKQGNLGAPLFLMVIMAMMTLPMPTFLLDVLFTFNIALSLVVLLVAVYSLRPLDFATFPTILLVATLLRLALNVASTRVVLLHGHEGGDAAGKVIEAFGHVVIGGNYAVGIVVFAILVIINFVVVTKGAGRISEVSARFTLDAMPGKQMSIDADLNAGIISEQEAKARRQKMAAEADVRGAGGGGGGRAGHADSSAADLHGDGPDRDALGLRHPPGPGHRPPAVRQPARALHCGRHAGGVRPRTGTSPIPVSRT